MKGVGRRGRGSGDEWRRESGETKTFSNEVQCHPQKHLPLADPHVGMQVSSDGVMD